MSPSEIGLTPAQVPDPVIAILRGGKPLTYKEVTTLHAHDHLVVVGCKPRVKAPARESLDEDDDGLQGLG